MATKRKLESEKIMKAYTKAQLDLMEMLIAEADQYHTPIPWRDYLAELGHPLSSVRTVASRIRARRRECRHRADNRRLRAEADHKVGYMPTRQREFGALEKPMPRAPAPSQPTRPAAVFDSTGCTSTSRLVAFAEIRSRIDVQGITAGLLGDPPQGKSALDKKRLGIVDAPLRRQGDPVPKPVTLATRPWTPASHSEPQ